MKATVSSYPRIHCCLLDLSGITHRHYGGAGFSIECFPAVISATRSNETVIEDSGLTDSSTRIAIRSSVSRLIERFSVNVRVVLHASPIQHVGFGSKTAILMGVLKAITASCNLPIDDETIQQLSGRGGASGIGVNTFFSGGFLVDGGHAPTRSGVFLPSRFRKRFQVPKVNLRLDFPANWRVHLVLTEGKHTRGQREKDFFLANAPISEIEALRSIALVYHGIVPALHCEDIGLLRSAIGEIQKVGFKKLEIGAQSHATKALLKDFSGYDDCAVGLSSMGPLLYLISNEGDREIERRLKAKCKKNGARYLGVFCARNSGFQVE